MNMNQLLVSLVAVLLCVNGVVAQVNDPSADPSADSTTQVEPPLPADKPADNTAQVEPPPAEQSPTEADGPAEQVNDPPADNTTPVEPPPAEQSPTEADGPAEETPTEAEGPAGFPECIQIFDGSCRNLTVVDSNILVGVCEIEVDDVEAGMIGVRRRQLAQLDLDEHITNVNAVLGCNMATRGDFSTSCVDIRILPNTATLVAHCQNSTAPMPMDYANLDDSFFHDTSFNLTSCVSNIFGTLIWNNCPQP